MKKLSSFERHTILITFADVSTIFTLYVGTITIVINKILFDRLNDDHFHVQLWVFIVYQLSNFSNLIGMLIECHLTISRCIALVFPTQRFSSSRSILSYFIIIKYLVLAIIGFCSLFAENIIIYRHFHKFIIPNNFDFIQYFIAFCRVLPIAASFVTTIMLFICFILKASIIFKVKLHHNMASNKNLCEEVSKSPKKLKIADLNLCNYFDMRIVNEQNNSQNLGSISINQESKIISHVEE